MLYDGLRKNEESFVFRHVGTVTSNGWQCVFKGLEFSFLCLGIDSLLVDVCG